MNWKKVEKSTFIIRTKKNLWMAAWANFFAYPGREWVCVSLCVSLMHYAFLYTVFARVHIHFFLLFFLWAATHRLIPFSLWIMNETKLWNRFTPLTSRAATIRTTYRYRIGDRHYLPTLLLGTLQVNSCKLDWKLHRRRGKRKTLTVVRLALLGKLGRNNSIGCSTLFKQLINRTYFAPGIDQDGKANKRIFLNFSVFNNYSSTDIHNLFSRTIWCSF